MNKRFLYYWLPLLIWISGIFLVSSIPSIPSKSFPVEQIIPMEYPLHLTAFFVLFLLFYRLLEHKNKPLPLRNIVLFSIILTMAVAIAKECWQLLIPSRFFSMKDILVDGSAAILAMFALRIRALILTRMQ